MSTPGLAARNHNSSPHCLGPTLLLAPAECVPFEDIRCPRDRRPNLESGPEGPPAGEGQGWALQAWDSLLGGRSGREGRALGVLPAPGPQKPVAARVLTAVLVRTAAPAGQPAGHGLGPVAGGEPDGHVRGHAGREPVAQGPDGAHAQVRRRHQLREHGPRGGPRDRRGGGGGVQDVRPELRGPQAPPAPGGSCAPAGVPRGPRLWAVATAMRLPRARPSLGPPPLLEPLSTPAQASFTDGQTDTGGHSPPQLRGRGDQTPGPLARQLPFSRGSWFQPWALLRAQPPPPSGEPLPYALTKPES